MAFPEGKRSRDGRLQEFKGGLFAMAVKCQVPIIPISLSHTHAVMPSTSLFPVQNGRGKLHVHVHKAIQPGGKSESDLTNLVRDALLDSLPLSQHPASDTQLEQRKIDIRPIVESRNASSSQDSKKAETVEV